VRGNGEVVAEKKGKISGMPSDFIFILCVPLRLCLETQFFQTAVFQILKYTLVMTLLQFTILQFSNTTISNTSRCLGKTLVETNQPERDPAGTLFTEKNFG
jgi:hypothetical protein